MNHHRNSLLVNYCNMATTRRKGSSSTVSPFNSVHGGAYCVMSPKTHRMITWRIAKYLDCIVLSIDYRLAPQHVFPASLIDTISAYKYLLVRYRADQISFMGDSAGGNLVIAAMLYCRDQLIPLPNSVVAFSPHVSFSHPA
jgi:monoterpene epsilon-lactone hydrolase